METVLYVGQIIEDFNIKLKIVEINGETAKVEMIDCWDKYSKGGSPRLCFSSYLDLDKEYGIHRFSKDGGNECWIFDEDSLKRNTSQLLICIFKDDFMFGDKVMLDMDT